MGSLGRRLLHLERRTPERRCTVCRGWPPTRVTYVNADWEHEPARPERSPAWGWEPIAIEVHYVDGWRDTACP